MAASGLSGKRAIVAGAGHRPPRPGIGRAVALALASAGARVACLDLDDARAQSVAAEVHAAGGEAVAVSVDLRDRDGARSGVQSVVDAFGGVDICVDIIGEARWSRFLDFSEDDWDWSFATNLRQVYLTFQAAALQMSKQGTGGALCAVASVDGLAAAPYHAAYGAAKAGIVGLMKTLAEELGPLGIRANAVAPGAVWSPTTAEQEVPLEPQTPLRRPEAMDIALALTFLCSDDARCITGQTLVVDGGANTRSVFPDRYEEGLQRTLHKSPR